MTTAVRPPAGLTLAQVIDRCPALLALHGGTTQAFGHYLYRCAAPPVVADAQWRYGPESGGEVVVAFRDREGVLTARLSIDIPENLWWELRPDQWWVTS